MINVAILSGPYKEHLSAKDVGDSIEKGLKKSIPDIRVFNFWMADGGKDTAKRLSYAFDAKPFSIRVTGPNYKKVYATIYLNKHNKIALFDVAEATGIHLLKECEKNPLTTTSKGVGEILLYLRKNRFKKIMIGLGDTAINDGGLGILQVLGWKFFDKDGKIFPEDRFDIRRIRTYLVGLSKFAEVICLSDGTTSLCGRNGISLMSASKKGASSKDVAKLEEQMKHLNSIFKKMCGLDFNNILSSGSAGGIGAALKVLFNAKYVNGAEYILDKFPIKNISHFDLAITSEGEINYQTLGGKVPFIVANKFNKYKIPTIVFVGSRGKGFSKIFKFGVKSIIETDRGKFSFSEIKKKKYGKKFIYEKARELGKLLLKNE